MINDTFPSVRHSATRWLFACAVCFAEAGHAASWNISCGDNAALINAIAQSNQTLENDFILIQGNFADCRFSFSSADNFTDGPNALPSIAGTSQAGTLTISTQSGLPFFTADLRTIPLRFFHVAAGGDLTLSNVWLTDAGDVNGAPLRINGGAIYNRGRVAVYHSFIARSSGERGGVLYNAAGASALFQYVYTTPLSMAGPPQPITAPPPSLGGGVFNAGTLTVRNSWIRENVATNEGAGIYNDVGGTVEILQSSLASNKVIGASGVRPGGGLANHGTATLTNVSIGDNDAAVGAAAANYGAMTLSHVTIAENSTSGNGASAFYNRGIAKTKNSVFLARGASVACDGGVTTRGKNLASDASCGAAFTNVGYFFIDEMWRNPRPKPFTPPLKNPIIDATTDCSTYTGQRLNWDQLYSPRPLGKSCDVGATEYVPPATAQLRTFSAATPDFGLLGGGPASGLVLPMLDPVNDLPVLNLASPYVGANAGGSPLIQSAASFNKWFTAARTSVMTPQNMQGDWYGLPQFWNQPNSLFPTTTIPPYYSLQLSAYVDIPLEWYDFPLRFPIGGARLSLAAPDDVWVFLDGKLFGDAGGLHNPQPVMFDEGLYATSPAGSLMLNGPGRHRLDIFNARRSVTQYYPDSALQFFVFNVPLINVPTTSRISNFVAVSTVPGSATFSNDTIGCRWGPVWGFSGGGGSNYVGKALYTTEIKNISSTGGAAGKTLSNLQLEIRTLGTGNLVVHPKNLPMRVGGRLDALRTQGYVDGKLAPGETTQIPVAVCVSASRQHNAVFDAFGAAR